MYELKKKKEKKPNKQINNQILPIKWECFLPMYVETLHGYLNFIATARLIYFKQPYS